MFYLGIDQHARQLTVNLRDQNGDVRLRKQVSTRPAKVIRFFEELTACCAASGCGFWAIVEVCGFTVTRLRAASRSRNCGLSNSRTRFSYVSVCRLPTEGQLELLSCAGPTKERFGSARIAKNDAHSRRQDSEFTTD